MNPSATIFVYLALAAILPLGLLFDAFLPRHRAVLATLLTGFLFLPSAQVELGGVLNWNRNTAPVIVVMLGVLFRDQALLSRFRWRWWDLPMVAWCLAPGLSSLSNGFPPYDALSAVFYQTLWLGGPYFFGRLHIRTREQMLDLAWAIVIGCLIYVPFYWYEIRMSPRLHTMLYGYSQHEFRQTIRGDYYRPMVFLQHGLMAAMWMAMGSLLAGAIAIGKRTTRFFQIPVGLLALGLTVTFLAMQSLGAVVLLILAWSMLLWCLRARSRWPLLLLALFPLLWCGLRSSGALPSQSILDVMGFVSAERAESLAFRVETEDNLSQHVLKRPIFGWGTWGRDRNVEVNYEDRTLTLDGLWIISLSQSGFFGLGALLAAHLVPLLISYRLLRVASWRIDGDLLILGGFVIILTISMVDNLLNAMVNPFFILLMGAIPTVVTGWLTPVTKAGHVDSSIPRMNDPDRPRILGA